MHQISSNNHSSRIIIPTLFEENKKYGSPCMTLQSFYIYTTHLMNHSINTGQTEKKICRILFLSVFLRVYLVFINILIHTNMLAFNKWYDSMKCIKQCLAFIQRALALLKQRKNISLGGEQWRHSWSFWFLVSAILTDPIFFLLTLDFYLVSVFFSCQNFSIHMN